MIVRYAFIYMLSVESELLPLDKYMEHKLLPVQ